MLIDINDCDLNEDYFHFSNKSNVKGILSEGLKASVGVASKMVGDDPNVSVSMGAKGVMGIISSFIYMFSITNIKNIPEEYKKYFVEITDFNSNELIGKNLACRAITRKLKDEVYFRVILDKSKLDKAKIGGLTGFDIKIPETIDKTNIALVVSNGLDLDAYQFAQYIYHKAKNVDVFREINGDFFYLFENESNVTLETEDIGCSR